MLALVPMDTGINGRRYHAFYAEASLFSNSISGSLFGDRMLACFQQGMSLRWREGTCGFPLSHFPAYVLCELTVLEYCTNGSGMHFDKGSLQLVTGGGRLCSVLRYAFVGRPVFICEQGDEMCPPFSLDHESNRSPLSCLDVLVETCVLA